MFPSARFKSSGVFSVKSLKTSGMGSMKKKKRKSDISYELLKNIRGSNTLCTIF